MKVQRLSLLCLKCILDFLCMYASISDACMLKSLISEKAKFLPNENITHIHAKVSCVNDRPNLLTFGRTHS